MTEILSWIRLEGPFLIGHRGSPHTARENTLPSFEAALEAGCDGVELDVRMTADGELVVHHDDTLAGPGGKLSIEATKWSGIEGRSFGGGGEPYAVHLLDEVLDSLRGRCLINVELKPDGQGRLDRLVPAAARILDRVRPRESLLVSSFDPDILAALAGEDQSLSLAWLFSSSRDFSRLEDLEVVDRLTALHPRHDLVDQKLVRRARERGLMLGTWTVDEEEEARRLLELGVGWIVTNRPEITGACFRGESPGDRT